MMDYKRITAGTAAVIIDVSRGAEIVSFEDERIPGEVFWRRERSGNRPTSTEISHHTPTFYDDYPGGVQELFPNTADATTALGAELPFHGELTITPMTTIESTPNSLSVECELKRYPVAVRKQISLSESGGLKVSSTVTNLSSRRLPYSWGFHPVFSEYFTGAGATVVCSASGAQTHPKPFGKAQRYPVGSAVSFTPDEQGNQVLDLVEPSAGSADLVYIELEESWFRVGRAGALNVKLSWDNPDFNCLWLWQECHAPDDWPWWGRHHIVGIEPHTAFPAGPLAEHIQNGREQILPPFGSNQVTFDFDVIPNS
jgi:hypothetical protein